MNNNEWEWLRRVILPYTIILALLMVIGMLEVLFVKVLLFKLKG